jgi:hypothetical protein
MGSLVALALMLVPEVEVQVGYVHGTDLQLDAGAPILGLRIGVDVAEHLAISGRFTNVSAEGTEISQSGPADPGFSGWQALGELRAHSAGALQIQAAVAAGVARLRTWQLALGETRALHGDPAFAWQLSAGARLAPESWRTLALSAEMSLAHWAGLRPASQPGSFQLNPDPVTTFALVAGLIFRLR